MTTWKKVPGVGSAGHRKGLPLADKELLLKRTIADSCDYAENYDKIKVRPMDINTKGEFPLVV